MQVLREIWQFFATYILQKAPYMVGLLTLLGYALQKRKWYDTMAGTLKAIIGMMILSAGSGGLVGVFRPILTGLNDRFQLNAVIIDPYYGQNAVTVGVEEVFGKPFAQVLTLLLIAFIVNIVLVRFNKITKLRSLFTTGHVQVQQASTAYWLLMFALPGLLAPGKDVLMLLIMAVVLGCYWAVGSNLTVKPMQEITDGAGFAIAHQQMFGIAINYWLADKLFGENKRNGQKRVVKKVQDIELPGFFSIFNDNMVCTAILMTVCFGIILAVIGKEYFVEAGVITPTENYVWYCFHTSLQFAVYLAILQLGVRTFVNELTQSFRGISDKLLPSSVPGVDCAVCYGFGSANAIPFGFLAGLCGQVVAILTLVAFKSPVIIICGFVPVFFDNATIGMVVNEKGGIKATLILPFFSGLCQVFGSALVAGWVGLAPYGGYLGMWDWAVVWPGMTWLIKALGYAGVAAVAILLLAIPQIQYHRDKEGYFLITDDYEAYKKQKGIE